MVKAVVCEVQGGEDRFPAGPRALLSWFHGGRKRLESCNRFVVFIRFRGAFFREVTFSIFDQRDGQKDDVTMVKKTK